MWLPEFWEPSIRIGLEQGWGLLQSSFSTQTVTYSHFQYGTHGFLCAWHPAIQRLFYPLHGIKSSRLLSLPSNMKWWKVDLGIFLKQLSLNPYFYPPLSLQFQRCFQVVCFLKILWCKLDWFSVFPLLA